MKKRTVVGVVVALIAIVALIALKQPQTGKKGIETNTKKKPAEVTVANELSKLDVPKLAEGENFILLTNPSRESIYVTSNKIHVYGRASTTSAKVMVNGRNIVVGNEGVFEKHFVLMPGENPFAFVYEDVALRIRNEKKWVWTLDEIAPTFRVITPHSPMIIPYGKEDIEIAGEFMIGEEERVEEGTKVFVEETGLSISADGRGFAGTIKLPDGKHELTVFAVDRAGNKAKEKVSLFIDTKAPEITKMKTELVKRGGMEMLSISGKVSEKCDLILGERIAFINDDLSFHLEIFPYDLEIMAQEEKAQLMARDLAGNVEKREFERTDFLPPHWVELNLVEQTDEGAILQGKVSEATVNVVVEGIIGVSDKHGNVTLKKVPLKKETNIIKTTLTDSAGNRRKSDQWIRTAGR